MSANACCSIQNRSCAKDAGTIPSFRGTRSIAEEGRSLWPRPQHLLKMMSHLSDGRRFEKP